VTSSRWPSGQHRRIEAHILDVDTDLYGRRVGLEIARRLRGMVGFDDVDLLVAQMKEDVQQTRGAALSPAAAR
jgi:riboflavin kinase/FMN adenylyltransferase